MRRVLGTRWSWLAGIALVLGIAVPAFVRNDGTHRAAAAADTTPCASIQSCQQEIARLDHGKHILLPGLPDVDFIDGFVANPHVKTGGFLGQLNYRDSSDGRTFWFIVTTSPEWDGTPVLGFKAGCESLVGTVLDTPNGRTACLNEPKLGVEKITFVDSYFERDGVFYWAHIRDRRQPTAAIWEQDRSWALALVDSYQ